MTDWEEPPMFNVASCPKCSHDQHRGQCESVYRKKQCGCFMPADTELIPPVPTFDLGRTSPARSTDPVTSHQAAAKTFRRFSQRHLLLRQYLGREGLIDEQAAMHAGITKGCPWKRCSELREAGLIVPTGETLVSDLGAEQRVCAITDKGRDTLERMEAKT